MYAITAHRETTTSDGWTSSRQVPTFYLDESVQGILSAAAAERVARDILGELPGQTLHVYAMEI